MNKLKLMVAGFGLFFSINVFAANYNHHGGLVLTCEPAHFFDEMPAKESKISSFQDFHLTVSDNADSSTIKVWLNNAPVPVEITQERSGRFQVQGHLDQPITKPGRLWLRVTADSVEGCDNFLFWNVFIGA